MRYLCLTSDVLDNKTIGISFSGNPDRQDLFLARKDSVLYGYFNRCPHTGVSLNWMPDQFMNLDSTYIQCSVHGALFRVEDGFCVWGPCARQSLEPVELFIDDDRVYIKE